MPRRIPFKAVNFTPDLSPLASKPLSASWSEIVHAAITVGRATYRHVSLHGRYSIFERLHKIFILYAYLRDGARGRLLRTRAYDGLDPSEKSAVSYFLGLMSASLFSSKLLGVRYLSHLDVYRYFPDPKYRINPEFFLGKKKPDLVGQNAAGNWVAIEAKGRTEGYASWVVDSAKRQQLANLKSINSKPVSIKVATLAYFRSGVFHVHMEDPQEINEEASNLILPETEEYTQHWYEPFIDLVRSQGHTLRQEEGRQYIAVPFEVLDVTIGLDKAILDSYERRMRIVPDRSNGGRLAQAERKFIGHEGIFVELGSTWNPERMLMEPYERRLQ